MGMGYRRDIPEKTDNVQPAREDDEDFVALSEESVETLPPKFLRRRPKPVIWIGGAQHKLLYVAQTLYA